jgi:uncharacterized protein (TIGR00251 family)
VALPPWLSERDDAALVAVRVRPRGGRDAVDGPRGDRLLVRVSAPPVGGAANAAVRRLIASAAGVPPGRVAIVRGERGRDKLVRLEGVSAAVAARRLGG